MDSLPENAAAVIACDGTDNRSRRPIKPRMALTRELRHPTEYVELMNGKFSRWALNEERGPQLKGAWRAEFGVAPDAPLDLEIGTGNGYHFAHLAHQNQDRSLVGVELKFKPLVQSIRRALLNNARLNARLVRYDASRIEDLFADSELNNVYIHHPDPWLKKRQWKHRLIQDDFLVELHRLMRPGSFVDFKTDSADYFDWSLALFKKSPFQVQRESYDLHKSEWQAENFVTHFETIFLKQGLPIHYARLGR